MESDMDLRVISIPWIPKNFFGALIFTKRGTLVVPRLMKHWTRRFAFR